MSNQVECVPSAAKAWSKSVLHRFAHIQTISCRNQPEDVSQARQTIDDKLATMHLAMCSLRTHRNALASISGIPLEILTRILQLHAADQPPSKRDLGWIRVTHVCRFWRDAALHHPAMWSNTTTELGLHWLTLMLDRAKSVPSSYRQLEVRSTQDSERFLACVIPHLPHIHSLSISGTFDSIDAAVRSLKFPAQKLRALELTAGVDHDRHLILAEEIFEGSTPTLRRLYLNGVYVSWFAPILRGLTNLHLEHDRSHVRPRSWENNVLCALEGMPALETLHLVNVLPHVPSAGDHIARLSCLQSLTVVDEGSRCLDVFKQLDIPPPCRLHFECVDFEQHPNSFLPILCSYCHARSDPFLVLSVVSTDDDKIGLKLWRESMVFKSPLFHPPQEPDLFISVSLPFPLPHLFTEPIGIMCDSLPVNDVRVVLIRECKLRMSEFEWLRFFGHNCSQCSHLLVDNESDTISFCMMLPVTLDDYGFPMDESLHMLPGQGRPFLPNLAQLEFQHVDFRPWVGRGDWEEDATEIGKLLVETLDMRRTKGGALPTIRLGEGCVIDTARLDALMDIVDVQWDQDVVKEIPKIPTVLDHLAEGFVYRTYVFDE